MSLVVGAIATIGQIVATNIRQAYLLRSHRKHDVGADRRGEGTWQTSQLTSRDEDSDGTVN